MQAIGRLVLENRVVDRKFNWDKPKTWFCSYFLQCVGLHLRPHFSPCIIIIKCLLQRLFLFRIWDSATGCSGLVRIITHDSRNQNKCQADLICKWLLWRHAGSFQITCFTMFKARTQNNCKHTSRVSGAPWLRAPPAGGHGKICENLWKAVKTMEIL